MAKKIDFRKIAGIIIIFQITVLLCIIAWKMNTINNNVLQNNDELMHLTYVYNRLRLFDNEETKKVLNGIYYWVDEYYCVWAENRTMTDIEETEAHEYCHYLIDVNREHFCGKED